MIHLALPEQGIILPPAVAPAIACGTPEVPAYWASSPKFVTCKECLKSILMRGKGDEQ